VVLEGVRRANEFLIHMVRVTLGVLAVIFAARPIVTVDSLGLAVQSGNTGLLRGSSSTIHSHRFLVALARTALKEGGLPEDAVSLVESTSHEDVKTLLSLREYIDVAIPRGGAHLIQNVVEHSLIPVIETGVGNCHVYVDDPADLVMAERIILNAKTQRPSVCNAAETLLVHQAVAPVFLPLVITALREKGVEIRGCDMVKRYVPDVIPATEEDWVTEYLDLILAVKVVPDLAEAIRHINQYGTRHSEAIVTRDYTHAQEFLARIDAAVVYVNASTRFTDGEQFGMGAEIGISTQKLHARGPMGLRELTTTKFVVYGSGQVRE
ncbi:MAG: glutamate-5-semialdehyde dehydrogenase, partial [Atribacterota bacterium]